MADSGQQDRLAKIRDVGLHRIYFIGPELDYGVAIAGDIERGLMQLRAVEERGECPVAINIAIIIEGGLEAGPREFRDKKIDVRVADELGFDSRRRRGRGG